MADDNHIGIVSAIVMLGGTFGAILSFGVCGYYFYAALDQARRVFPARIYDEQFARLALPTFIWSDNIFAPARRSYLLSDVYACIATACMFAVLFARGNISEILIFGIALALVTAATISCWLKYRRHAAR